MGDHRSYSFGFAGGDDFDDRQPAVAEGAHASGRQPSGAGRISDFLESFRHRPAAAMGHLQQRELCGKA